MYNRCLHSGNGDTYVFRPIGRSHAVGDYAHRADQADPADDDDYGGGDA